jgi:hypothetical protein
VGSRGKIDTTGLPQDLFAYQQLARTAAQAEFAKRLGTPVLLFTKTALWDPALLKQRPQRPLSAEGTRATQREEATVSENGVAFLSPVRKRPDSLEAGIIVGRAASNDVCVPIASVSNIHCAIHPPGKKDPAHWTITDLGSSNGTYANHVLLQPYQDFPLDDGQHIRLGKSIVAWFLSAPRLWAVLRDDRQLAEHIDV